MKKKNIIIASILTLVAIGYTLLVKFIDVRKIGPNKSAVGFARVNKLFSNLIGSNMTIYKITEILGLVILLIVLAYAALGVYQLIKGKSIKKIDREIIVLGIFYVVVMAVYVLFEKVVINYRPILIDGELEASYPSSHTMLALCVGISSLIVSRKYLSDIWLKVANIVTVLLMLGVLGGRVVSGVHWISDIGGGIIISCALLMWFYAFYDVRRRRNNRRRHN